MGFLDSIVSGMIRDSTGYNVRPLIRAIGGKRLLMMGGAALAGGMMAQSAQGQAKTGQHSATPAPSGAQPPPDLPPVPGGSPDTPTPALPDLPPTPSATPGAPVVDAGPPSQEAPPDEPTGELLVAIVQTMIAAAAADGELKSQERELIEGQLQASGLPDDSVDELRSQLDEPRSPRDLAAALPEGEDPEVLVQFAILVARSDGDLSDSERQWIESLCFQLSVTPDRLERIFGEVLE